jgi:hypothetical protein
LSISKYVENGTPQKQHICIKLHIKFAEDAIKAGTRLKVAFGQQTL